MGLGLLVWLALLGGVAALVVWAVRRFPSQSTSGSGADALEILKRRYARGEVTREQFEQMKTDLGA